MPRRETRYSIESALDAERRKRRALRSELPREVVDEVAREMARQRARIGIDESVEIHVRTARGQHKIEVLKRRVRPSSSVSSA